MPSPPSVAASGISLMVDAKRKAIPFQGLTRPDNVPILFSCQSTPELVAATGELAVNEPAQNEDAYTAAGAALNEREIDAAIAVCDGDARAALKAALIANSFLM